MHYPLVFLYLHKHLHEDFQLNYSLTWQELSRQHGTALNRTLAITARNVLLYAFLLIYVLVL